MSRIHEEFSRLAFLQRLNCGLMPKTPDPSRVPWHRTVLRCAAVYNIVWGTFAILWPLALFRWVGAEPLPNYPELWQCIGMIVGVYGVGYWIAAEDPGRHWPIVLVGLLGKIFGPIGFVQAMLNDRFPAAMAVTIVMNDLIWWVPFALILRHSRIRSQIPVTEPVVEEPVELAIGSGPSTPRKSRVVWSSLQSISRDSG